MRMTKKGRRREDVVSELVKFRYRHEETNRILYHLAKVAADAMIGKLLDIWREARWLDPAVEAMPGIAGSSDFNRE